MLPEQYFLRYAFPCAQVLLDLKRITQADYDTLKKAVHDNKALDRAYLEKTFPKAIKGMKKASKNCCNIWDVGVIKKYFHERHDEMISKDLPPIIKELCRVKQGILAGRNGPAFKAEIAGEKRNVFALYENPQAGDKVFIHYWYAVEKA